MKEPMRVAASMLWKADDCKLFRTDADPRTVMKYPLFASQQLQME
jgi:hypothetical protein